MPYLAFMQSLKSPKIIISLGLLIASAVILCAVNPAPILSLYKIVHVKYVRIAKSEFSSRFSPADLAFAIDHAKNQTWVQTQIQKDLEPFQQGITKAQIDSWFKIFQEPHDNKLAKFTVHNNIVTVEAPEEFQTLRSFKTVYSVIDILAQNKQIPDCVFLIALNDYLAYVPPGATPAAIFSFAKHTQIPVEQNTILVPDWMNVRYWDVLRGRIALANKLYPWQRKKNLIHWRGGIQDSMQHRAELVALKRKFKFLDVGMTAGNHKVPFVDPEHSVLYKYQIALDGARCTWERMIWQMSSNAVMLKPYSPQQQWFYQGLEPFKNYVPIHNVNEGDIAAVYEWLQGHDYAAREIVRNANKFAKDNFKTQDFFAYYAVLLQEYAGLMR